MTYPQDIIAEVKKRILDSIEINSNIRIPLSRLKLDGYLDAQSYGNDMIMYLTANIYAETLPSHTILVPSSWWQHFKQECFPSWLCKYFPVQTKKIVVSSKAMYPEYEPPYPDMKTVFVHEIGSSKYTDPRPEIVFCKHCGYPTHF